MSRQDVEPMMGETCQKPLSDKRVCTSKAFYSFVLEGGIVTRRCKYHMALNIIRMELTNVELSTIQREIQSVPL